RIPDAAACAAVLVASATSVRAQVTPSATLQLELRIDGNDDLVMFSFIRDLVPMPDGSVIVAEPREGRLRHFGANGHLRSTFGRDGAGPGEYRAIGGMGQLGDSIWVRDIRLRRTTWLSRDGRLLGSMRWDVDENARPGTGYVVEGYFRSGRAWGEPSASPASVAVESAPRRIELLSPNGTERLGSIAAVPSMHGRFRLMDGPTIVFGTQPFADAPLVLASGASERLVIVDRRSDHSRSRAFPVVAVSPRGDTLWTTRVRYQPRPIARSVRDSVVGRIVRISARNGATEAQVRAALHLPAAYPPVTDAFEDNDGRIWLRREDEGPRVVYQRLSAAGALDLEVSVGRSVRLRAARGNLVWAISTDEDGVPSIERYAIIAR
ncbi:MAG TPA: hypothetical protein PK788_07455, partial [Gemmatimonadaceae bacterium]|nr:hypothetical protein [Gemmatimonadaceae bacterium]